MPPLIVARTETASATGTATYTFGPATRGQTWMGAVTFPTAPTSGSRFVMKVDGLARFAWVGPTPSATVEAAGGSTIQVTASGLLAGQQYTAVLSGGWSTKPPIGIVPQGSGFTTVTGTLAGNPTGIIAANAQTIVPNASGTAIKLADVVLLAGNMTTRTNGLVVPISGEYLVVANLGWQNAGGPVAAGRYVMQAGGAFLGDLAANAGLLQQSGSGILVLSAGALVTLVATQFSGSTQASFGTATRTNLALTLVSQT